MGDKTYRVWTQDEVNVMIDLYKGGANYAYIANFLGRTKESIRKKLSELKDAGVFSNTRSVIFAKENSNNVEDILAQLNHKIDFIERKISELSYKVNQSELNVSSYKEFNKKLAEIERKIDFIKNTDSNLNTAEKIRELYYRYLYEIMNKKNTMKYEEFVSLLSSVEKYFLQTENLPGAFELLETLRNSRGQLALSK